MNVPEIFHILWNSAGRNLPGVILRIISFGLMGFIAGILVFIASYKFIIKKEFLKFNHYSDRFLHYTTITLWAIAFPVLSLIIGLIMGITMACNYVIIHEHLGAEAGKLALKTIVSAIILKEDIYETKKMTEKEGFEALQKLIKGEKTIAIDKLKTISSKHIAEISTEKLNNYIQSENKLIQRVSIYIMEKSVKGIINSNDKTEVIFSICEELVSMDNNSDKDGKVTVEQISDVICRKYLEQEITNWIFRAGLLKSMVFFIPMVIILLVPPLLAFAVRYGLRLYKSYKKQDFSQL